MRPAQLKWQSDAARVLSAQLSGALIATNMPGNVSEWSFGQVGGSLVFSAGDMPEVGLCCSRAVLCCAVLPVSTPWPRRGSARPVPPSQHEMQASGSNGRLYPVPACC